jgi:pyridoxamine 5'-phosphate oxidase
MAGPLQRLVAYFDEARSVGDPCATFATFTTVDTEGVPMSRVITIRDVSSAGITASVNAASPKVSQLLANGKWELLGFWPSLMVQFRLRGTATVVHDQFARSGWEKKSAESQLADLYHATVRSQSSPVPSREDFLAEVAQLRRSLPPSIDPPESVVSLRMVPSIIEIWIGSPQDRLHDRRLYMLDSSGWSEQVLVP